MVGNWQAYYIPIEKYPDMQEYIDSKSPIQNKGVSIQWAIDI